ncbi:hypothetical protein ACN077_24625 [Clostridium chromiireducens]|uniref:hypothetical protein n=1 Tax=Clostridium chromiireducens TaxID=225345 RepID=UPI003AF67D88
MNNKELRAEIEQHIRFNGVGNETFQEMHIKHYNEFFRIFQGSKSQYDEEKSLHKNMKVIDFIESIGRLQDYLEIVKGNSVDVQIRYCDFLREERRIRDEKMLEELNKDSKPRRNMLEELLKNAKIVNLERNK